MKLEDVDRLDWAKGDGLLPAIVQDVGSGKVLMLGFMNREALQKTLDDQRVTFFSRTKNRLWTKGETSGHFLHVASIVADCNRDTLLITAYPHGPACHTGTRSCFGDEVALLPDRFAFLIKLGSVIAQRINDKPEGSYTARLWSQGRTRMAQKVGEESVEVALAAVTQDDGRLISESADLLFHLALLLESRGLSLVEVVKELERRHDARP